MNVAFFANPQDNHDCKWINKLADHHQTHLICIPRRAGGRTYVENDSVRLHEFLPKLFPYKNPLLFWRLRRKLRAFMVDNKIDLVHSMYAYPNSIYAYMSGHPNHLITTRGSDILVDFKAFKKPSSLSQFVVYPLLRRFMQNALKGAAFITSTSTSQKDAIAESTTIERHHLIRTGIDTGLLENYAGSYKSISNDDLVIFSARNMKPVYNIELVLEGVSAYIRSAERKVTLKIIDDNPESDYSKLIRQKIESLNLAGSVEILPLLTLEEMVFNYLSSDIVLMAPKSDGTPNSALESMYLRRPVILGALQYDEDLFNEQTVWKMKENSPDEVQAQIESLMMCSEEELDSKLDVAHKAVSENASLESALARVEALYEKMMTS